jgi:hypothetical protein
MSYAVPYPVYGDLRTRTQRMHRLALLRACRLDLQDSREGSGHVVTSRTVYERYLKLELPKPHPHLTFRSISDHMRKLEEDQILQRVILEGGSRGRRCALEFEPEHLREAEEDILADCKRRW